MSHQCQLGAIKQKTASSAASALELRMAMRLADLDALKHVDKLLEWILVELRESRRLKPAFGKSLHMSAPGIHGYCNFSWKVRWRLKFRRSQLWAVLGLFLWYEAMSHGLDFAGAV